MKKLLITLLISSLAISSMTGCGKKEVNQGVIISAGDSSNNTSASSTASQASNTTDAAVKDGADSDINSVNMEKKENNTFSLYGIWTDVNSNTIGLYDNGNFDATLLNDGISIYGTYETDNKTYIKLTYNKSEEIENPTEQEMILNKGIKYTETTVDITLSIDENAQTIRLNDVEMSLYSEVAPVDTPTPITSDIPITESTKEDEKIITNEAELEQIRQQLTDMGIDPDTGLPMEDSQKLIDMGIDPLTGQPIQTEGNE